MKKLVLRNEILDKIKAMPFLIAEIATVMDFSTSYVLKLIRHNDVRLTQVSVVHLIKRDMELQNDDDVCVELEGSRKKPKRQYKSRKASARAKV